MAGLFSTAFPARRWSEKPQVLLLDRQVFDQEVGRVVVQAVHHQDEEQFVPGGEFDFRIE